MYPHPDLVHAVARQRQNDLLRRAGVPGRNAAHHLVWSRGPCPNREGPLQRGGAIVSIPNEPIRLPEDHDFRPRADAS